MTAAPAAVIRSAPSNRRRRPSPALIAAVALAVSLASVLGPVSGPQPALSVIVRGSNDANAAAVARSVSAVGGRVTARLGIISGFAATIPAAAVRSLQARPDVAAVTPNGTVQLLSSSSTYTDVKSAGSLINIAVQVGAPRYWAAGFTGRGIDVAVIDSGVSPVVGLAEQGKVVNGVDLSFERRSTNLRHLDTYGHGTHIAGVIAGRDPNVNLDDALDGNAFVGIAPGARIVNLKVANAFGAADVSQVIAAVGWVIENRNRDGLNIRVLNLSFGTDGSQDYVLDPLAYAVEQAWHAGITVVVAAGNSGTALGRLNNPARDPYVIAVGASNTQGTLDIRDDRVTSFSSRGDGRRNPDVVAPGKQVVGLRVPGGYLDQTYPGARIGERFFRGEGTSQAAAVVSGAAALIAAQRPHITPDQLKHLLRSTARSVPDASGAAQGKGMINLWSAFEARTSTDEVQTWTRSSGAGSLDAARGSIRVFGRDGTELRGEVSVFDDRFDGWFDRCTDESVFFDGNSWSGFSTDGNSWSSDLEGNSWSGTGTNGNSWSGSSGSPGPSTDGNSWSSNGWLGVSWGKKPRGVPLP